MGMIFTVLYEWRQTLVTPIMVHAGSNFLSAVALTWVMWNSPGTPILGISGDTGPSCVVQAVVPDSAAANAGIQRGDVIITFGTERIRDFPHLVESVRRYQPGDRIPMSIERAGSRMDLEVVLGRRGE
jgi:S1-C subfamily serine protease